jgi:16S rRNA processing protein RimM
MVDRAREPLVCVAVVAAPHGVRGALRLRCFTERPESVASYGPVFDANGARLFRIDVRGAARDGVIVTAEGVHDRDAAERLRGVRLHVPRSALPATGDDEFYVEDLVGLDAVLPDGAPLGRIAAVSNFGAGDVVELESGDGATLTLPFTRACFPEIDLAARRVVCRPPAEVAVEPPR